MKNIKFIFLLSVILVFINSCNHQEEDYLQQKNFRQRQDLNPFDFDLCLTNGPTTKCIYQRSNVKLYYVNDLTNHSDLGGFNDNLPKIYISPNTSNINYKLTIFNDINLRGNSKTFDITSRSTIDLQLYTYRRCGPRGKNPICNTHRWSSTISSFKIELVE
ncbi:MAG: hypothetical protein ACEQSF_05035 [Solirubrobacteraceae bacterium]